MPRYFFQIHDNQHTPDQEGAVFTTEDEARIEAIALTGALLRDNPEMIASSKDWHVTVEDEEGATIFQLCFDLRQFQSVMPLS